MKQYLSSSSWINETILS